MAENEQGPMVPQLTFGDRLLIARRHRGVLQSQVADGIGRALKTIGNWEDGSRIPQRARDVNDLADYLEIDVDWLDPGAEIRNKCSGDEAA